MKHTRQRRAESEGSYEAQNARLVRVGERYLANSADVEDNRNIRDTPRGTANWGGLIQRQCGGDATMKVEKRLAWKLVRIGDRSYCSVLVDGKASVVYKIDKRARAPKWLAHKGYHLLVFSTRRAAEQFRKNSDSNGPIFRCEIGPEVPLPKVMNRDNLAVGKCVPIDYGGIWPKGTLMTKWVKLLPRKRKA